MTTAHGIRNRSGPLEQNVSVASTAQAEFTDVLIPTRCTKVAFLVKTDMAGTLDLQMVTNEIATDFQTFTITASSFETPVIINMPFEPNARLRALFTNTDVGTATVSMRVGIERFS